MTGWRQIGTAPRDGRTILAYLPAYAGREVRQDVVAIVWDRGSRWATAYSGARLDAEPTHWMPLPDPPGRPSASPHSGRTDRGSAAGDATGEPVRRPVGDLGLSAAGPEGGPG